MKVLVTGGRDFTNKAFVFGTLDQIHAKTPIALLIHGACQTGADRFADDWATNRGVKVAAVPANWAMHGKRAGPLRNVKMLNDYQPDLVVGFPGGKGTAHCIAAAHAQNFSVYIQQEKL